MDKKKIFHVLLLFVIIASVALAFYIAGIIQGENKDQPPGQVDPALPATTSEPQPFRPGPTGEKSDARWDKYRPHGTTTPKFEFQNP